MVESNSMARGPLTPFHPPLYVVAYTADGQRHSGLLEPDRPLHDWLVGPMNLRVAGPSGAFIDIDVKEGIEADYLSCLNHLGDQRAWAPTVEGVIETIPNLELWAPKDTNAEVRDGPILAVEADRAKQPGLQHFYAVIRSKDGVTANVASGGMIYIDVNARQSGITFVPRALLDTGLAGAFWGYVGCGNAPASLLVAKRLLEFKFGLESHGDTPEAIPVMAAAHAVLIHRSLLPTYGSSVMAALNSIGDHPADAALLKAFLGMAQLSTGEGKEAAVTSDVRAAIHVTASHQPVFGETLRILNAHFSVLADIARSDANVMAVEGEISNIEMMLRSCYVGGQSATYIGEPAIGDRREWHDILAGKKKVLAP